MSDIVQRRRARERVETDPAARQRYDEMIAIARELTRETGDERDVMIDAATLAFDLAPQQPVRVRDRDPYASLDRGPSTSKWSTLSFPLAPGDEGMREEEVHFRYAVRETLAWLRGGITPAEFTALGLSAAWEVLSVWVDKQRGVVA